MFAEVSLSVLHFHEELVCEMYYPLENLLGTWNDSEQVGRSLFQ